MINANKKIKETVHQIEYTEDSSLQKDVRKEEFSSITEDNKDDSIKYLQILFYFVQDSRLFKIKLPGENVSDEGWILKFLQFSPDIIVDIYGKYLIFVSTKIQNQSPKFSVNPCLAPVLCCFFS